MIKKTINTLQVVFTLIKEFLLLILFSVLIFVLMGLIEHQVNQNILIILLIIFSVIKVYILISRTLIKMEILTRDNHNIKHVLLFSVIVVALINVSFTLDYLCVSEIYMESFSGLDLNQPLLFRFFDLMYFSMVTFTSVGYGDIFPIGKAVKFLTMLEIATAFVTVVFIISSYTRNTGRDGKEKY